MAPRSRTRKAPLAEREENIVRPKKTVSPTTQSTESVSLKAEPTVPAKKKTMKAKAEVTLPSPEDEVEHLRAQIEDLTAKLDAAAINKPDVKPKIVSNPFGGSDINLTPGTATSMMSSVSTVGPPPKRSPTAYTLFCAAYREDVCKAEPKLSNHEVIARLADMWKNASENLRQEFDAKCAPDRERFEREKAVYDARVAVADEERTALGWYQTQITQQRAMEMYQEHLAKQAEKESNKTGIAEDIKKPKKARSAYALFLMSKHTEMSEQAAKSGEPKPADGVTLIAQEWKALLTSRRKKEKATLQKFMVLSEEDSERYEHEMEVYEMEVQAKEKAEADERDAFKARAVEMFREQKKGTEELDILRKLKMGQQKTEKEEKAATKAAKKVEKEEQMQIKKTEKEEKAAAKAAKKAEKALLPKRPRNAYAFFFAENMKDAEVRKQSDREGITPAGVIGARWKDCTDADKKQFVDMAAEDRQRYDDEMANLKQ